jgi:hypothetical protein
MKCKLYLINLVLLLSCSSEQVKTESNQKSTIEDVMAVSKKRLYDHDAKMSLQTLVIKNPQTTTLTLDYIGTQPKRLEIRQFSEESNSDFKESFLFGESESFPIVYTFNIGEDTSFQAFTKDGDVVSFVKNKNKKIINELDSNTKRSKIYALSFFLLDYISYFQNLNELPLRPFRDPIPILITCKDNLVIKSESEDRGEKVATLKIGTPLLVLDYLISSGEQNKGNIWYKVSTENNEITGWIKGHSQTVEHFSDGD